MTVEEIDAFGQDAALTLNYGTVICQFPIREIRDVTLENDLNDGLKFAYTVTEPMPEFGAALESGAAPVYEVEMWLMKDSTFRFEVKVIVGSHVKVTWDLVEDPADDCQTDADHDEGVVPLIPGVLNSGNGKTCVFPFSYDGVLYYGCRYVDPDNPETHFCATATDSDGVATEVGRCNGFCPRQRPRIDEVADELIPSRLFEGKSTIFQRDFIKAKETNLFLSRTFQESDAGKNFTLIFKGTLFLQRKEKP